MTLAESFRAAALCEVQSRIAHFRQTLTYSSARALPAAQYQDIALVAREVQVTTFRQENTPSPEQVLVTVQIARHALGGMVSFSIERGVVFSLDGSVREATDAELQRSLG